MKHQSEFKTNISTSPLFQLNPVSGLKRKIPKEAKFIPIVRNSEQQTEAERDISTNSANVFSDAIANSNYSAAMDSLSDLYSDKSLLNKTLLECSIKYIGSESIKKVHLTVTVICDAEYITADIVSIVNLLVNAPKSNSYFEFLDEIKDSETKETSPWRRVLRGKDGYDLTYVLRKTRKIFDNSLYECLDMCDRDYWLYPYFLTYKFKEKALVTALDKLPPLPDLTSLDKRKVRLLEKLDTQKGLY